MLPYLLLFTVPLPERDRAAEGAALAARIDARAELHWQANQVQPAPVVNDTTFLRRLTLDLAGRIPTATEAKAFAADASPDKRARAIQRLMTSPEFALHLGRILDEMIQEKFAGDAEFLAYLRSAVASHKPWDQVFRDLMLGPWDTPDRKGAERFLTRRVNSLDDLTNDTARVFFGVNVSCAKCHDHPLVPDWTQDHYFGLASFFNPTYEGSKTKGKNANATVQEKMSVGPVQFTTTKGERRTAKVMFLSNREAEATAVSRRENLVSMALEERKFFSRAIVNKLWAFYLGRGLVAPLDQMHSANPPAIPELLDELASDLAEHNYDLERIVAGLVSSKLYQRASLRPGGGEAPSEKLFAQALLRPLTTQQMAMSVILALGDGSSLDQATTPATRRQRYRDLEGASGVLLQPGLLDPRSDRFQSSTGEALFLSNHPEVQKLMQPAGNNLAARLTAISNTSDLIDQAIWTVLGRAPEAQEKEHLVKWLEARPERAKAVSQLLWALLASAEFRFNY